MRPLVFQTDFGLADGAVSAMYGVALGVEPDLRIFDITHEIEQFNIWEGAYRLLQTVDYWPSGTVFVSVVDPGVGGSRRSIVVRIRGDKYVVTPDNGTLTFLAKRGLIEEARELDECKNRIRGSEESFTFYGRDVYAFTGAKLASGKLSFEMIGEKVPADSVVVLPTSDPCIKEDGSIEGTIDVLDVRFGSLWTNVPKEMFKSLGIGFGERVEVTVSTDRRIVYKNTMQYARSFADVYTGEPLVYMNSLGCIAVAINKGYFAKAYNIGIGNNWRISFQKVNQWR
ncbi:MAG: S-adenosyl-l-methionine hydroxide adenosyltransferase family protein [Eubacteriales bacterium]|nr:S-adenosyl-l-methionine hydroxide adenosyltransferase family protein [Eubacteriales bacterium]